MTAASQGEVSGRRDDPGNGGKGPATALHIGVVLEAFLDWPLERVLAPGRCAERLGKSAAPQPPLRLSLIHI